MKGQKNLTTEKAVKIEVVRTEVTTEHLQEWFEDLKEVVQKYDILPENIYNMDEMGFNIGDSEARHVIMDTNIQSRYQAQPGRQEWVTAIECICADGSCHGSALCHSVRSQRCGLGLFWSRHML